MRLSLPVLGALGFAYLPAANAWGAAGHEIVATIAQMYLHPSVMPVLCDILDMPAGRCHLASVATWADQNRFRMRWSAPLHYVGALDDYPSQTCAFPGPKGWAGSQSINVLDGIQNTTRLLQDWVNEEETVETANEALKFLIHFLGDMHQPLHLTGRDRGGNSVKVRFGSRTTNLHSLWDGYLIAKAVRTVPRNYSRPLPYPRVEKALRGTIYDSYIRRLLWEGLLNPWSEDLPNWLSCPTPDPEATPAVSTSGLSGFWFTAYSATRKAVGFFLREGVDITPDGPVICPYYWAKPTHALNCDLVWPRELDEPPFNVRFASDGNDHDHDHDHDYNMDEEHQDMDAAERPHLIDLDTPEYAGVIYDDLLIEKLLAQGGIRLAGVLNYLFAKEEEKKDLNELGLFLNNIEKSRGIW
jgi:hypothetical protein